MKIVFLGRVLLRSLLECWRYDKCFPAEKWGFPLGSELVKGLVALGHDVHVVMEYGVYEIERYCSSGATVWLVPESSSTKRQFLTLFRQEVKGMRSVLREINPDIVFAQWMYHNAYAGITSGYPTLVVAHDSPWRVLWQFRNLRMLIRALYAQIFVLPRAKYLTAVSPHIVRDLRRLNGVKGNILMIPNGISQDKFRPTAVHRPRNNATTILMITQWGRLKNSKIVLRAFSMLRKHNPGWRLIVYGDYMDERGAGKWLRDKGLSEDGIELRSRRPPAEIRKALLTEADIFISPSLEESFGMVFIEAMAIGVPCIGGRNSGAVPWVLNNGAAGLLTNVKDVNSVCRDIEVLMNDVELRRRFSDAGVRHVREHFDLDFVVKKYEEAFKEVLRCES